MEVVPNQEDSTMETVQSDHLSKMGRDTNDFVQIWNSNNNKDNHDSFNDSIFLFYSLHCSNSYVNIYMYILAFVVFSTPQVSFFLVSFHVYQKRHCKNLDEASRQRKRCRGKPSRFAVDGSNHPYTRGGKYSTLLVKASYDHQLTKI